MLRRFRNYRFDPFAATTSYSVITDEAHAIPASSPYWVRTNEIPDSNYTDPTSGTPVYIRRPSGTVFTEVSTSPGLNEFRVDYTYKTGWIEFNSGNADNIILICYRGTGSPVTAEVANNLQRFQPCTPTFGGDGSRGDVTISADTTLAQSSGGFFASGQYTSLTIDAGITLSTDSATCAGLFLAVQNRLKLGAGATITVAGRGGDGGSAVSGGTAGNGDDGGYGGGGGGTDGTSVAVAGDGGSTIAGGFLHGAGRGGAGATSAGAGGNGVANRLAYLWRFWQDLQAQMVYGAGGGGSWFAGGRGGGFLVINCGVLEVDPTSGAVFDASGDDGITSAYGGSGGGAGGTITILANRIIGDTAANIEAMCDVTGGAGGGSLGAGYDGGDGADGWKKVIELYEYNRY